VGKITYQIQNIPKSFIKTLDLNFYLKFYSEGGSVARKRSDT
jgi:hypothetical protein